MSMKTVFSCALTLALVQAGMAGAQEQIQPPAGYPDAAPAADGPVQATPPAPGPSSWLTYSPCDCCGPIGGHGLISTELYVRTGPSYVVGGGALESRIGDTGWMIQAGGRSLFFDATNTRAWTIDLGLSHMYNDGEGDSPAFAINGTLATVRALHRTAGTLMIGREYYLVGSACSGGFWGWRVGFDGGIRYGTTRLDINGIDPVGFQRFNSWQYGPVVAVHSDVEIPFGCCLWVVGVRAEWDETYNNRLVPLMDNDINDVNALLTIGVRY